MIDFPSIAESRSNIVTDLSKTFEFFNISSIKKTFRHSIGDKYVSVTIKSLIDLLSIGEIINKLYAFIKQVQSKREKLNIRISIFLLRFNDR